MVNPDTMQELTGEIRGAFARDDDLTFEKLPALPHLNSCVEEADSVRPAAVSRARACIRKVVMPVDLSDDTHLAVGIQPARTPVRHQQRPAVFVKARDFGRLVLLVTERLIIGV
ncbi:cytochrome P450 [Apiospora saccharicola]|uniref:Cytochrome P450 n=1 Tax=Apiospora saccharicola TaxID=335842 RepID=A0ABR1W2Q5_9PEZI